MFQPLTDKFRRRRGPERLRPPRPRRLGDERESQGHSLADIKLMGGWKTDAMPLRYIRGRPLEDRSDSPTPGKHRPRLRIGRPRPPLCDADGHLEPNGENFTGTATGTPEWVTRLPVGDTFCEIAPDSEACGLYWARLPIATPHSLTRESGSTALKSGCISSGSTSSPRDREISVRALAPTT